MAGTLLVTACQPTGKTGDVIGKQPVKVENGIMTTEVLMAFGRVSSPVVSPDKSKILYGVSYENLEQNKSNREALRHGHRRTKQKANHLYSRIGR